MSRPLYPAELALLLGRARPGTTMYAVDQFGATHSPIMSAYLLDDGSVIVNIEVETDDA